MLVEIFLQHRILDDIVSQGLAGQHAGVMRVHNITNFIVLLGAFQTVGHLETVTSADGLELDCAAVQILAIGPLERLGVLVELNAHLEERVLLPKTEIHNIVQTFGL